MKTSFCGNCNKEFRYDSHQKTGKWCSNKCQMTFQYLSYIKRWKDGLEDGISGKCAVSQHIRRYLFEKSNSKCVKCGWGSINPVTKKIPLHIDHIDGNVKNNKEGNLQLICPNCHSLTVNFGILNKGNGRYSKHGIVHPKNYRAINSIG